MARKRLRLRLNDVRDSRLEIRRPRESAGAGGLLLVALGAVAGVAIGMAIADRAGGIDGLMRGAGNTRLRRHRDDGWRGDERRSQSFDAMPDDDSELAPEAIAHVHLHGRYPEAARRTPARGHAAVPDAPAIAEREPFFEEEHDDQSFELETRVLEAFRNDPMLAERPIDIGQVDDDIVELTGWVEEPSEVSYAIVLAKGVPGVERVVNSLVVRPRAAG